jgi:hypothetical protein
MAEARRNCVCLTPPQVPHYVPWINVLRGGLNAVLAWVALMACVLSYTVEWEYDHGHPVWHAEEYRCAMTVVSSALHGVCLPIGQLLQRGSSLPGVLQHDEVQQCSLRRQQCLSRLPDCTTTCTSMLANTLLMPVFTQVMSVGVPVMFIVGGGICWLRLVYAWRTALKFKQLPPGVKPRSIHRFTSEFDVEVASRIGRVWDEDGVLDAAATEIAENVLKVGTLRGLGPGYAA